MAGGPHGGYGSLASDVFATGSERKDGQQTVADELQQLAAIGMNRADQARATVVKGGDYLIGRQRLG